MAATVEEKGEENQGTPWIGMDGEGWGQMANEVADMFKNPHVYWFNICLSRNGLWTSVLA